MSLTRPMAIAHNPGSSRLPSALYKKGLKEFMYFAKSSSSAFASAPTAAKTVSGTLDLLPTELRICRSTFIMRSAAGLISPSSRWIMALWR